ALMANSARADNYYFGRSGFGGPAACRPHYELHGRGYHHHHHHHGVYGPSYRTNYYYRAPAFGYYPPVSIGGRGVSLYFGF
ncbi:MAG: hypothetical protein AB7F89_06555, partial [Pirellulaceae bacterium]